MTPGIEWWRQQADSARHQMRSTVASRRVLIEVAAQHPLKDGLSPGAEFQARLDRAVELVLYYATRGWTVEVYVPGSRHRSNGVADKVSLSHAGTEYLKPLLPADVSLHGDDLNDIYLGETGVYGSADECFVTASYFKDGQFEQVIVVLSPQQLARKLLHYLAFGIEPLLHTAPVSEPFHDIVTELMFSVPEVLDVDPTAQGPESAAAQRLRQERRGGTD
ncbi:MAG: hypothetical protein QM622_10430 [Microbacterium sp.]